ncbi:MAG: hypothetical protein HDS83_08435 [Bacteroidales bacterium]|nr:hypothetical protein [Bacteroidales bacterium]
MIEQLKPFLIITALLCALYMSAVNITPDTIHAQELHEVIIEASNQDVSPTISTYYPGIKQKNAANSAISLLGLMAIPQLDVDMGNSSVKTIAGQSVTIFVDFNESTSQELDGIKTRDVKRVDVYDFPIDPRFKGAHHVVNLIMQKYEYGGYTKTGIEKQVGVNKTDAYIYSKLSYKSMIYDLYADESYLTDRHIGLSQIEIFRFPNSFDAGSQAVQRTTSSEAAKFKNNINNVAIRALYSISKIKLSNRISLNLNHIPVNDTYNGINYTPDIIKAKSSMQQQSSDNLTLGYYGNYLFTISSGLTLQTDLAYSYGNNKSNSVYASGPDFLINNEAKEISHDVHLNPKLSFRLNNHNNIMLFGSGVWRRNNIKYFGDSPSFQKYIVQAYFAGLHYDLNLAKIQTGGEIGWAWEKNKISEFDSNDNFPQINVYANYMVAQKHLLTFTWNYGKDVPDASQKSPNMLQQNELMWYTGTPALKDYKYMNTNLTYTWLLNNRWQFAANIGLFNFDDRCVAIYLPIAPDGTMLRKYVNGGNYHAWMYTINATSKFFDNRLVINIMPQYWMYRTAGAYRHYINNLNGRIQATYYLNKFYLMGSYTLKRKFPVTQAEYVEEVPEQYQIRLGWSNGNLNLSVTGYNFFRSNWIGSVQTLQSEYYDFYKVKYTTSSHMRISLALTYTLGYGKKISRNDEVKKGTVAGSAILK